MSHATHRTAHIAKHLVVSRTMSTRSSPPTAPTSPVPPNPLGDGNFVKTAACLIIGDEVLNGKTKDSNSNFFAKACFDLGIDLKRIEVIADDADEIAEAARRLVAKHELVLTSGGIGPTHDDITYESLAKAFDDDAGLEYHDETLRRMALWSQGRPSVQNQTEEQRKARHRMALFPTKESEVIFACEDLWVPIVRLRGRLCILPGIPRLFERLCQALLATYTPLPPSSAKPYRRLISTKFPESNIAPYLTSLAERVKDEGIRIGSYPRFLSSVDVSLIGKDPARLDELVEEVCKEVEGTVVAAGKLGEEEQVGERHKPA